MKKTGNYRDRSDDSVKDGERKGSTRVKYAAVVGAVPQLERPPTTSAPGVQTRRCQNHP